MTGNVGVINSLEDVTVIQKYDIKHNIRNSRFHIRCEIALTGMPEDFTDEKSTLVQVMAHCR